MGYENLDGSQARYNVNSHLYDADSDMHILLDDMALMYDNKTMTTGPALAIKGLKAASEATRTVLVDKNTLERRNAKNA